MLLTKYSGTILFCETEHYLMISCICTYKPHCRGLHSILSTLLFPLGSSPTKFCRTYTPFAFLKGSNFPTLNTTSIKSIAYCLQRSLNLSTSAISPGPSKSYKFIQYTPLPLRNHKSFNFSLALSVIRIFGNRFQFPLCFE